MARTIRLAPVPSFLLLVALPLAANAQSRPATEPATSPPATRPAASQPATRPAAPAPVTVADVTFTPPSAWVTQPPSSAMRKAQYRLPGEDGADGECVVFFFGSGQGGGVDANVDRWLGQVQDADGAPPKGERETREIGGAEVTTVRAAGTFLSGMPGRARIAKPDWALHGLIIESPKGPVFVKVTGPEATLEAMAEGFAGMVETIQVEE